jgi:hypothetical protein
LMNLKICKSLHQVRLHWYSIVDSYHPSPIPQSWTYLAISVLPWKCLLTCVKFIPNDSLPFDYLFKLLYFMILISFCPNRSTDDGQEDEMANENCFGLTPSTFLICNACWYSTTSCVTNGS